MIIEFIPNAQERINEMFSELQNFDDKFNEEVNSKTITCLKSGDIYIQEKTLEIARNKLDYLKGMQKEYEKLKGSPSINEDISLQVEVALNHHMRYLPLLIGYYDDIVRARTNFFDKLKREFA
ncbi:MAG: hypothetical protein KBT34_08325 [Prevotella sp.]|nr:hypothetical protein [Candidatus Prevotella equi]